MAVAVDVAEMCGALGYFCATVKYVSLWNCKQEKHLWTWTAETTYDTVE